MQCWPKPLSQAAQQERYLLPDRVDPVPARYVLHHSSVHAKLGLQDLTCPLVAQATQVSACACGPAQGAATHTMHQHTMSQYIHSLHMMTLRLQYNLAITGNAVQGQQACAPK
jgi:hypothetical protein